MTFERPLMCKRPGGQMPYLRCPDCRLLVHLIANDSADVECARCRVRLREDALPVRSQELSRSVAASRNASPVARNPDDSPPNGTG